MVEAKEGVTTPILLTAGLPPQVPPAGLANKLKAVPLVQNSAEAGMLGVMVSVTDTIKLLDEGHTVGLGLEVVL